MACLSTAVLFQPGISCALCPPLLNVNINLNLPVYIVQDYYTGYCVKILRHYIMKVEELPYMRGNGSLYLRGTTWWMKFYRDGRPVCMSCKTASRDQAAAKLRKEIRKSDEEFTEPRFKRTTIDDLVVNLLSYYDANAPGKVPRRYSVAVDESPRATFQRREGCAIWQRRPTEISRCAAPAEGISSHHQPRTSDSSEGVQARC